MMNPADKRRQDDALLARLIQERSTWDEHWKDLGDHFLPRSLRFNTGDRNKGGKKNGKLLTSTPARAARTLSAGMFSSITSPARPWFQLGIEDSDLAKFQPVKEWLDDSTKRLRDIIAGSNAYKCFPAMFRDLGVFGTHAMHIDEDPVDVIRCYPFAIGSYYLTNSSRLNVDLVVRKYSMTARQLVERFKLENCPAPVQSAYKGNQTEQWFDDVVHVMGPNPDHDPERLQSRFKRFRSDYYMQQAPAGQYLSQAGYDDFPAVAPRWETNAEDVYGTSPGMLALPDARSMMIYERDIAKGIQMKVKPTWAAPVELEGKGINPIPGSTTFTTKPDQIRSLYDQHALQIDHAVNKQQMIKEDLQSTMYVDLFLMLMNSDRRQITAEEIRAKQEEKILALGEPLERLNDEGLGPFIERVFSIADRRGLIAPPPEEMRGVKVKVVYVSILHQVQKMVALGQIDRVAQFVGGLAGAYPQVLDKFDADQAVDEYGEGLNVSPRIIRSDEAVAKIRADRAAAQQQQAQMQTAATMVDGAKTLSETDTGGQNALTDIMRSVSGAV